MSRLANAIGERTATFRDQYIRNMVRTRYRGQQLANMSGEEYNKQCHLAALKVNYQINDLTGVIITRHPAEEVTVITISRLPDAYTAGRLALMLSDPNFAYVYPVSILFSPFQMNLDPKLVEIIMEAIPTDTLIHTFGFSAIHGNGDVEGSLEVLKVYLPRLARIHAIKFDISFATESANEFLAQHVVPLKYNKIELGDLNEQIHFALAKKTSEPNCPVLEIGGRDTYLSNMTQADQMPEYDFRKIKRFDFKDSLINTWGFARLMKQAAKFGKASALQSLRMSVLFISEAFNPIANNNVNMARLNQADAEQVFQRLVHLELNIGACPMVFFNWIFTIIRNQCWRLQTLMMILPFGIEDNHATELGMMLIDHPSIQKLDLRKGFTAKYNITDAIQELRAQQNPRILTMLGMVSSRVNFITENETRPEIYRLNPRVMTHILSFLGYIVPTRTPRVPVYREILQISDAVKRNGE